MERRKLTDEDKKFLGNLPVSEVKRLHDELGICFECNDGRAEYSYTQNAA